MNALSKVLGSIEGETRCEEGGLEEQDTEIAGGLKHREEPVNFGFDDTSRRIIKAYLVRGIFLNLVLQFTDDGVVRVDLEGLLGLHVA